MKNYLFTLLLFISFGLQVTLAAEGMWLPFLLKEYNIDEMQQLGFKLTADDIYNINQSCLKDAVVGFVRLNRPFHHFCSGEVISAQGLVLTNHHCGIGTVQAHSTAEHNYLADGFWAQNFSEELAGQNIGVCFLKRMEDVTNQVLNGVTEDMDQAQRDSVIEWNIGVVEKLAQDGTNFQAHVDEFFNGNNYYLSVYEIFSDVRLVGVPPISVGKFGGDTDNWVWPRHTGDFTLFRIYADKNNQPAAYSPDNVPYKPVNHLQISLKGVNEGDFTMVLGYPGTTKEYLPSFAVELTQHVNNPITIQVRTKLLGIMDKAMEQNPALRLKYTDKAAGMANAWKKLIGENLGLQRNNVVDQKKQFETGLQNWINSDVKYKTRFGHLLSDYQSVYSEMKRFEEGSTWMFETLLNSDLIEYVGTYQKLLGLTKNSTPTDIDDAKTKLIAAANVFFSQIDQQTEINLFTAVVSFYQQHVKPEWQPYSLSMANVKFNGNFQAYTQWVFKHSIFTDKEKAIAFLEKYTPAKNKKLSNDPLLKLYLETVAIYRDKIAPRQTELDSKLVRLDRLMMEALREYEINKKFYPDANSTFRVAYGQVKGYKPADAITYNYFTTLKGIIEKEDPDIYDYSVPEKLKELYQNHDYGPYANADGTMPVCFIATNHTTGGNSGSPVLNAYGQLIGTNFDRVWEGTMSDLNYDQEICRNITLDIRYTLFIIDKFAGASRLINEMEIGP